MALLIPLQWSRLPEWKQPSAPVDWLVGKVKTKATVFRTEDGIVLANGLLSRTFRIKPNAATVGIKRYGSNEEFIRATQPEAILTIDGKVIEVGGLIGQPDRGFLTQDWLNGLKTKPDSLEFQSFKVSDVAPRMKWKKVRPRGNDVWPPKGKRLTMTFVNANLEVQVHYEMVDGLPVVTKSITLINRSSKTITLDKFTLERLSLVESESIVDDSESWQHPNVTVLTDYSFGGGSAKSSSRTTFWEFEPEYTSQVNYNLRTPCLLEIRPPLGPAAAIAPGESFESFHAFEIFHDSWDRERKGLEIRHTLRTLAPWCTENPLMLHLTSTEDKQVMRAIDQAAECGFEMVIFSFGSGLNMEDTSPANISRFKKFADYAKGKGLDLGGYSLLASRRIDDENDVINPKTGKPDGAIFGASPCLGSKWGRAYFAHVREFIEKTGFTILEHDGSYPGDVCASNMHPGHRGLEDSQWTQYQTIAEFYRWCRSRGVFLNIPDYYFLAGGSKTGMGYREVNWSLPRAQQHIHCRQNLFDGTWEKTPSMGWMFVPLVEYQGGGAAATIEPLKDHLPDYEMHLANNLGYGAQACYRGPRLYDNDETKRAVQKWVNWFKKHRDILESDVIHVKRADGRSIDGILHVNPEIERRGLAVFYNPTDEALEETISLPLYYTGVETRCTIAEKDGSPKMFDLNRHFRVPLKVKIQAHSMTWFVIRSAD